MLQNMIPAEEFARTETVTITPVIQPAPVLQPGRYWVGPLEHLFPSTLNWLFPVGDMVREALDALATVGTEATGAVFQYGDTRVPFLTARVADGYLDFRTAVKDNSVIESTGRNFCAETYIVVVSTDDAIPSSMERYLWERGTFITINKPVKPMLAPNSVRLIHNRLNRPETVFEVTGHK